jgi:hypothetical protein
MEELKTTVLDSSLRIIHPWIVLMKTRSVDSTMIYLALKTMKAVYGIILYNILFSLENMFNLHSNSTIAIPVMAYY